MATEISAVCTLCSTRVTAEFAPGTGTRDYALFDIPTEVQEQCFVADTIQFADGGQLIFAPHKTERGLGYFDTYNVICRKLIVTGGGIPINVNPCGPDDPGRTYDGKNLITWKGRLQRATSGGNPTSAASDGQSFEPTQWVDQSQGNNGKNGGRGADGSTGQQGADGINCLGLVSTKEKRPTLNIVVLEVEVSAGSHLIVDWDGQSAGDGGRGQVGGKGGDGMGGRDGLTDKSVWGDSCETQPGNGGNGGDGGNGGPGGKGGRGGDSGDIWLISPAVNLPPGGVLTPGGAFTYKHAGATGGNGGPGARGGQGSNRPGRKGRNAAECNEASDGLPGSDGFPDAVGAISGGPGGQGAPGKLNREAIDPPNTKTCADLLPAPLSITSIAPNTGAKNSVVSVVITGIGFDASAVLHSVDVSGVGVTVGPLTVSLAGTTINCDFTIGNLAPSTARDVTVKVGLTASVMLASGFTVV